jgi:hypothetical protein
MHKKILFLIAATFLLSGCNTLKQNVVVSEPTNGERARVRVVIQDIDYRGVRAYPNSTCVNDKLPGNGMVANVQMILGFEKNLNNKKIGMPETAHSVDKNFVSSEIYVAANEPITFRFHKPNTVLKGGAYDIVLKDGCYMKKTLIPEPNGDYELIFTDVPQCLALAHKIVKTNELTTMVPVEYKDTTDCGRKR